MGRFNDFASGDSIEIELTGDNPPDVTALKTAAAETAEATQSCSVSGGAAWTMVIK